MNEWTYTEDSSPNTFHIYDPTGKSAAYLQIYSADRNLFLLHNDLRKHPYSHEFSDHVAQDFIDELLAAKDSLIDMVIKDKQWNVSTANQPTRTAISEIRDRRYGDV